MMNLLLEAYPLPDLYPIIGPALNWLMAKFGNIGIAVILFTVALKLITLPLDYWSRAGMKKNSLKMEQMKPQLDKLQKQYGHDKALLNQKMQKIYKDNGYSMFGACVPTLVTMVLFILIFQGFNSYLKFNVIDAYNKMQAAYFAVGEDPVAWAAIADTFKAEFMPSFLWIQNVWSPDVFWTNSVLTANDFQKLAGVTVEINQYNPMVAPFAAASKPNGWLILPVLSGLTMFISQWLTSKTQAVQMEATGQGQTQKTMLIMMPIMMGVFGIMWNSAFAIYLVTSSVIQIFTTLLINWIVEMRFKKQAEEIKLKNTPNR